METADLMSKNVNVEDLVKSFMEGISTESESGLALRMIQTSISGALVTGLNTLLSSINKLNSAADSVSEAYLHKVNQHIQADTLDIKDLSEILTNLYNKQFQILELYRKVAQGKELFPTDVISEEEKKVIKLLKSFRTPSEKKKFIELCENILQNTDNNDFDLEKSNKSNDLEE